MSGCDDILRRRFIAIATDRFEAGASYPPLDVAREVSTLRDWLCNPELAMRPFNSDGFEPLERRPAADDIKFRLTAQQRFTDADAVVLYVTGHGQTDKGAHWTVLEHSDPQRLSATALETIYLLRWLASHPGLEQVLLVIDLCHAGDLADEVPAALKRELPRQWIALLTTSAGADAKVGAFAGAVKKVIAELRAGSDRDTTDLEAHLESHIFIGRVKRAMWDDYRQNLIVLQDPYGPSCCLPNPKYDPARHERVETAPARRDLAILKQDMGAHWGPRARVTPAADAAGWLFTGRRRLVSRLVEFTAGPPGTLIVSGRAGSGKSAALARLVTCSDPMFRATHGDLVGRVQPVPPEGAVDVAVLATGKTAEQIAAQIAGAFGAVDLSPPATDPLTDPLDHWVEAIAEIVAARETVPTVVLDALDEASDPLGVALTLLPRLNPPAEPQLRLILGVRSTGADGHADDLPRGRDLADLVTEALSAQRVAADGDDFWEHGDLAAVVEQVLVREPSPYQGLPDMAVEVARVVEHRVDRSYLLALLVAGQLVDRAAPLAAGDPRLGELLGGGVADMLDRDLRASLPDPADRVRALLLLRAAALAFGRGVPWRRIWPAVATAIAPDGRELGDSDIEWLLRQRIGGYLVRDLEDGVTVYRPFHDALKSSLAAGIDGQLGTGQHAADAEAEPVTIEHAHRLVAGRLRTLFGDDQGQPPPAYARRHLADHAAAGGILDDSVLRPETLPYLDAARLSRLLRLTEAPPGSSLWLWLSAWRGVRHRWSWTDPEANAAALDVALRAAGGWVPRRRPATDLAWYPLWAEWSWGGTIVAGNTRGTPVVAFGTVEERPVLAVGAGMAVRVWDAATGQPLGEPFHADAPVRAVAMADLDGVAVVAAAGGSGAIRLWDAATGRLRWRRSPSGMPVRAMTLGRIDGRLTIVTGDTAGDVWCLDAATGTVAGPPMRPYPPSTLGSTASVRAVALREDAIRGGRPTLAVGRGDGGVEQWEVPTGTASGPTIDVGAEVNAVVWGELDAEAILVTADANGVARVWEPRTGLPVRGPCQHRDEIRALALTDAEGRPLLATASFDSTATVWDLRSGTPLGEPLPHPGPVTDLAFGIVDGRTMLATACADGNIRLWDPSRPSGVRVSVQSRFGAVALTSAGGEVLLATGAEGGKAYVRRAEHPGRVAEIAVDPGEAVTSKGLPPSVAVTLGVAAGRRLLGTAYQGVVQLWDVGHPALDQLPLVGEHRSLHDFGAGPVALRLDGETALLAVAPSSGQPVSLIDLITGRTIRTFDGVEHPYGLAFLAGEQLRALAFTFDDRVELYDLASGALHCSPIPTAHWTRLLALDTIDGTDVLAVWEADLVRLWDIAGGTAYTPPITVSEAQNGIAFARAGGRELLLTAHFATVRVWNPRTGRQLAELPFGTSIDAMAVEQTGNGRLLVAVSGPGIVVTELFDPATRP